MGTGEGKRMAKPVDNPSGSYSVSVVSDRTAKTSSLRNIVKGYGTINCQKKF